MAERKFASASANALFVDFPLPENARTTKIVRAMTPTALRARMAALFTAPTLFSQMVTVKTN
jgi:hypothetical protein